MDDSKRSGRRQFLKSAGALAGVAVGEIAALVDVAAGDQAEVDLFEHFHQLAAHGLRDVADRDAGLFEIARRVEKQRLVQEQRDWFSLRARKL